MGLGSFKALGGAYAVMKVADTHRRKGKSISDLVVATASAGNHGRSVAWGARNVGCKSRVYIHNGVSKDRASAMADYGAEVIRIDGNYDQALAACIKDAQIHDWALVSDTSWDGYRDIPLDIMSGYGVLMKEALEQMGEERDPATSFCRLDVVV